MSTALAREWHAMRAQQAHDDNCCQSCGEELEDGEAFDLDGDGPLCYGCFDELREVAI